MAWWIAKTIKLLRTGDVAPEFALESQTGTVVRLSQFRGQQNVVLYFYPKDNTAVCTKEACAFRDSFEQFAGRDTAVLGVSSDGRDSHAGFAVRYGLPFPLLTDSDGAVRKAYGVSKTFGLIPGRVTFVIDKQGVIRAAFAAQFKAEQHVAEALRALD